MFQNWSEQNFFKQQLLHEGLNWIDGEELFSDAFTHCLY